MELSDKAGRYVRRDDGGHGEQCEARAPDSANGADQTENAERQQSGRQEQATALERAKPMNTISGSPSSRVVVVSAEEVRKAREKAAQPIVKRPRVSVAGPNGRKAFEALFNDESNSSAAPSA